MAALQGILAVLQKLLQVKETNILVFDMGGGTFDAA